MRLSRYMAEDQWTTLIAAAANAPSHAEHSHLQSSVQITLHDCQHAAGWGDRLPTICQRITLRRQHNRTIGKLSVWNNRPEQLSPDSPTIGRYDSTMGLSS